MVFEEFFLKKKIDLNQLKDAEPALFEEFKSHYSLMGEKSFDHTKKYWFNRLRHTYPLSPEEENRLKELFRGAVTTVKTGSTAPAQNQDTSSTAKPAGFRPKFKMAATGVTDTENKPEDSVTSEKPAGFKPRFKSGVTQTEQSEVAQPPQETESSKTEEHQETAKPIGFKPRFKAGVTSSKSTFENENTAAKQTIQQDTPENIEHTPTTEKPLGFKPRFKAGITNASAKPKVQENKEDQTEKTESDTTQPSEETTDTTKPLGFKPRFRGNKKEE